MQLRGKWHEQGSAAQFDALLQVTDDYYSLAVEGAEIRNGALSEISVAQRLGNVERKLTLVDGSIFTCKDNDAIDHAFASVLHGNRLIHKLESNLAWVMLALVLTVATTYSFFTWGLPWISHATAHALPQKTGEVIGGNALAFLDDYFFQPSQLSDARQGAVSNHFNNTLLPAIQTTSGINYNLHFRAWGEGDNAIPNALALPSGDVILTDRFVELSDNQDQIDAVLLHEIGHIEHRHTLEMVTQSTLIAVILAVFTGDVSSAADMGVGLGSILVTSGYSRKVESEADQFALQHMLKIGINPQAFAEILDKITTEIEGVESGKRRNLEEENDFIDYLSTHPNTNERIKMVQHYVTCFRKRLTECK